MAPFPQDSSCADFVMAPAPQYAENGDCYDDNAAIHFEQMLLSCVSPDIDDSASLDVASYAAHSTSVFGDDSGSASSMTTSTECDETLASLDELYSSDEDECFAVKGELPVLESVCSDAYDEPQQQQQFCPEEYNPALFGWDQFPSGLHPMELPMVHSFDCATDGDIVNGELPALHAETIPDMDVGREVSNAEFEAALRNLPDGFDGLVRQLV